MSVLEFRLATLAFLIIYLTGNISASFWRPITFPTNPNDNYYKAFQNVPKPEVTAKKLMTNFLHIHPLSNAADGVRRSLLIEDIVIVMDGSGSIGQCEFDKGKKALQYMMETANSAKSDTKYATITFASSVAVNFKFLPYSAAANKISQISYPGGGTNTAAALEEAKKLFDDRSSGRRDLSRKVVLLVTDGQSNNKQQTILKASELKNNGAVQIFVVAVGSHLYGIDETVQVASYPPQGFMFRVKNLRGFWEVVKLVIKEVNPGKFKVVQGQYDPPCN